MRKNKEGKKGHETIIGKIIYGVLLFAPLLSIASRCLYVIFNKNAVESFGDSTIQETTQVTNPSQLLVGSNYIMNYNNYGAGHEYTVVLNYSWVSVDWYELGASTQYNYNGFRLAYNNIQLAVNGSTTNEIINFSTLKSLSFTLASGNNYNNFSNSGNSDMYLLTYKQGKLDNVFEYAIDQVEKSNLYNWSKSTGMYQAVKTTAEGLGITNTFTPMLLTYWFMISIIYFIYDIGLMLIMIVHRKIHELQESV